MPTFLPAPALAAVPLLCCALLAAGCAGVSAPTPHAAHLSPPALTKGPVPPLVVLPAVPPPPRVTAPLETFSVVVNNLPLTDLLFALARDARLNIDIHPGLTGRVTLSAIDQTLPQILTRLSRQADMRFELEGPNLTVMPDTPFLRTYPLDYVNISREMQSSLGVTTQVFAGSSGAGNAGPAASGTGNNSLTRIENRVKNQFWDTLIQNIRDILRETDKILPEGSSEETEEVSGNIATTGTGLQPAKPAKRSRATNSAEALIAQSPQPAELQKSGTRTVRRTTWREAASVIAHPETGVLTVRASSRQHEKIQAFLDQVMSAARKQVLIEATVVEVELSSRYYQGIDWSRLRTGATGFAINQSAPLPNTLNNTFGMSFITGPNARLPNVTAMIDLLEQFGKTRVLSSPKISVLNNQSAILKVVDNEVYFTLTAKTDTNQTTSVTTFTTTLNSVPVGFVMNVTPQVSNSGQVLLNVRPSISRKVREVADPNPELSRANVVSRVPVIRTREMESMLRVDDGNIVVMGGLMEDELNRQGDTLPGVSPEGLGRVFANREESARKTELVIFIRPVVIKDASIEGDYRAWHAALPGADFFSTRETRAR